MQAEDIETGIIVRVSHLSPGVNILASQDALDARQAGQIGRVAFVTRDDDLALAWVRHGAVLAPYYHYELVLVGVPWQEIPWNAPEVDPLLREGRVLLSRVLSACQIRLEDFGPAALPESHEVLSPEDQSKPIT